MSGDPGAAVVWTVGHGTRSTSELIAIVRAAGVETIIDVRRFPGSRRHPQFTREALEVSLPHAGISYAWLGEELGGRRTPSSAPTRHPAWRNDAFRAYADHMDSTGFRATLDQLVTDATSGLRAALMCAETLWWRCHRRLIADALVVGGVRVVHLLDQKSRQEHPLHESLRVDADNRPVYDVGVDRELDL